MSMLIIRALRLPFISASILPFIFGSLIDKKDFNFTGFCLGLVCVIATHLSANLINDYADSRSRADWQDSNFYKFFGGSKLIQEGLLPEGFYLKAAVFFAAVSFVSIIFLSFNLKSPFVIIIYLLIFLLAWSYSTGPLQFSYRRGGEIIIFLLFGPALVMGGYFIQTRVFPDLKSFLLSLPFGILTSAILFANEIPDFTEDMRVNKINWVSFLGQAGSFRLYHIFIFSALLAVIMNVSLRYLSPLALVSLVSIFPALMAAGILKTHSGDKIRLMESSRLTIAVHSTVGVLLILSLIR